MKAYYKLLKCVCITADIFALLIFGTLITVIVLSGEYEQLGTIIILLLIFAAAFAVVEIFLLKYYGNVVTSVEFSGNDVIIITNRKRYVLPDKYFTRVKEDTSTARTYITYDDGQSVKRFVFQMKYSPFKTYHLDIAEMKKHMPYTIFE